MLYEYYKVKTALPYLWNNRGLIAIAIGEFYFENCSLPLKRNLVACKECEFLFSDAEYSTENMDEYYSHYYTGISYAACPTTWNYLFEREVPIVDHVISCLNKEMNVSDIAVGPYFLAKAYEGMGYEGSVIRKHFDAYSSIVRNNEKWKMYADKYEVHLNSKNIINP